MWLLKSSYQPCTFSVFWLVGRIDVVGLEEGAKVFDPFLIKVLLFFYKVFSNVTCAHTSLHIFKPQGWNNLKEAVFQQQSYGASRDQQRDSFCEADEDMKYITKI